MVADRPDSETGEKDENYSPLGNLGAMVLKRLYMFMELFLVVYCLADLTANYEIRWHIKMDRPYLVALIFFTVLNLLLLNILLFSLAFFNNHIEKTKRWYQKRRLQKYRPIAFFTINLINFLLLQHNALNVTFQWCNIMFPGLCGVYLYMFLEITVPLKLGLFEQLVNTTDGKGGLNDVAYTTYIRKAKMKARND